MTTDKIMLSRSLTYIVWIVLCVMLFIAIIVVAQDVLVDDISGTCPRNNPPPLAFEHFADTLNNHGVTVHYTSEEGYTNLINMKALFIVWFHPDRIFDTATKAQIIEFARNGGEIVIWTTGDTYHAAANDLLSDPAWQPTLQIGDSSADYYRDTLHLIDFYPFTDNVGFVALAGPPELICGEHAYPFGYNGPNYCYATVAISYPFLQEHNCSSYVVFVTGTAWWVVVGVPTTDAELRFGSNILLTAAGCEGYELPPGAIPGGGFAEGCGETVDTVCFAHPLPFTPNSDGINDYAKFEYPGMHRNAGVLFIYTLENAFVREVRNGDIEFSPKGVIFWDGKDGYGRLMENGVYLYIVQDGGKTVCKGTVYLAR